MRADVDEHAAAALLAREHIERRQLPTVRAALLGINRERPSVVAALEERAQQPHRRQHAAVEAQLTARRRSAPRPRPSRSPRPNVMAIGFSTSTCLPRDARATVASAWCAGGVASTTASTSLMTRRGRSQRAGRRTQRPGHAPAQGHDRRGRRAAPRHDPPGPEAGWPWPRRRSPRRRREVGEGSEPRARRYLPRSTRRSK